MASNVQKVMELIDTLTTDNSNISTPMSLKSL